jgi:hypothetical protein
MYKTGVASQQALDQVRSQGFAVSDVDFELPRIPSDLTLVGSDELMSLMVQYTEFANFASTQLSFAAVDERFAARRAEEKHNDLVASFASADSAGRSSRSSGITMHKSQASADPEYLELQREAESANAYATVLKSVYENLDRSLKVLSREVTRRTSSTEQRSSRWSA